MSANKDQYVTTGDCEKRHGIWGRVAPWLAPIAFAAAVAAMSFASDTKAEVRGLQVRNELETKRVDRIEQKIDEGFDKILQEIRKGK